MAGRHRSLMGGPPSFPCIQRTKSFLTADKLDVALIVDGLLWRATSFAHPGVGSDACFCDEFVEVDGFDDPAATGDESEVGVFAFVVRAHEVGDGDVLACGVLAKVPNAEAVFYLGNTGEFRTNPVSEVSRWADLDDVIGNEAVDIELIEINETFAAQYLACERALELNRDITNVNGGGISLGHPVGASGARIVTTLLYKMKRRQLKLGLASLCAGGGMGTAIIIKN